MRLVFGSDWAFDKHFVKKKPATDPRDTYDLICRTAEDLKTAGWGQNDKGWWRTPAPQEGPFRERRTPSESTQGASEGIRDIGDPWPEDVHGPVGPTPT